MSFWALAEARPLVLVFEDLHWADDGLLDFVDHLAGWAGQVPLLVAGTRQIVHQLGLYIACGEPQRTWQWTARPV